MKPKKISSKTPIDPRKKLLIGIIAATTTILSGIVALVLLSSGIGDRKPGTMQKITSFVTAPFQKKASLAARVPDDEKQERVDAALKKYKPVYKRNPDHPIGVHDETLIKSVLAKGMPHADKWNDFIAEVDKAALLMVNENGSIENIRRNMRDTSMSSTEGGIRGLDVQYKELNDRYTAIRDGYIEGQKSFVQLAKAMSEMYDMGLSGSKDIFEKKIEDMGKAVKPEHRSTWENHKAELRKKMEPAYEEAKSKVASGRMTQESIYKKITTNEELAHRFKGFVYGMTELRGQMIVNRAMADAASSLVVK